MRVIFLLLLAAGALWPCVASASVRTSEHTALRKVVPSRDEDRGAVVLEGTEVSHMLVMLTKWFSLPRLETRTKESNICASTGVANLRAQ